ncbi:Fc.00g074080.m01.CDS01 [Cosmosporella sp. VM-42]
MEDFRGGFEPRPSDIFIAVMGVTGAGKSTFISACTGAEVEIGHDLRACTQNVAIYRYEYSPTVNVYLVDTPGFDDTTRSDTEVLREIADWLYESFSGGVRLRGVLYLHRITDPRMQGSARSNLFMFKKLCGPDALKNVILVTTMWEKVDYQDGERREEELKSTPDFWGLMMDKGSQVYRHQNNADSARRALKMFLSDNIEQPAITLDIQDEMVNGKKKLNETGAGQEVESALQQQREKFQKQIAELQEMMKEALEMRDRESAEQLRQQKEEMDQNLDKIRREREELKVSMELLHRDKFQKIEEKLNAEREANRAALAKMERDRLYDVQRLEEFQSLSELASESQKSPKSREGYKDAIDINKPLSPPRLAPKLVGSPPSHLGIRSQSLSMTVQGSSYYLCGPKQNFRSRDIAPNPDGDNVQTTFMIFGTNGSYIRTSYDAACRTDEYWVTKSANFDKEYPKLDKHLWKSDDLPHSIALGPKGTFFLREGENVKHNLPSSFPTRKLLKYTRTMWLGYGGAWVAVDFDGFIHYDLKSYYPTLEVNLHEAETEEDHGQIKGLAMDLTSPYVSIVVFEDGTSIYFPNQQGLSKNTFERFLKSNRVIE